MPHKPYTLWAPFYDFFVEPALRRLRGRAVQELRLKAGHSLLIAGIGTGLDLPLLPRGVDVAGLDMNEAMLGRARRRADALGFHARLKIADAEKLPFPAESFDRVYLPLIAAVARDGGAVLAEALRVVKPGGRVVVMDKFLPARVEPGPLWRLGEAILGRLATHVDRRWEDIARRAREKAPFTVVADIPGPLRGFFRIFVLEKRS